MKSLRRLALAASALSLFPALGFAQAVPPDLPPQGAPLVLRGQTDPANEVPTVPDPLADASASEPSSLVSSARPAQSAFESQSLAEVGLWGVAASHPGIPVLNSGLWKNADAATLGIAFERIAPTSRFPSMQDLVRAALFSGGAAPSTGDDPVAARRRFEAAARFGPAQAAADLAARAPKLTDDLALSKLAADTAFALGRTEDACAITKTVSATSTADLYWLQARAVCYLVAKEPSAADLSADLALNQGLSDPWFFAAIGKATGSSVAKPPQARYDSGLAIELSSQAGLLATKEVLAALSPAAASALIGRADSAPAFRASIATRAVFAGSLYAPDWAKLLAALPAPVVAPVPAPKPILPSPKPGARPAAVKPAPPPPAIDPWLAGWRALQAAETPLPADPVTGLVPPLDPLKKTAALVGLIRLGKAPNDRAAAAEMLAAGIKETDDVADTVLVEAALLGWDVRTAARLRAGLMMPADPVAASRLVALDAALVAAGAPVENAASVAERRVDLGTGSDLAARASARDVLLMLAAGAPVSTAAKRAVFLRGLPTGTRPSGATMAALRDATSRLAMGEVAVLAALATQDLDPATMDAEAAATIIRSLRDVGLDRAAKGLARDLILAARGLS